MIGDQTAGAIYNPNISVIKPTVRSSFWSSQCSKRFVYESPKKEETVLKIPTPPSNSSSSSGRYKRHSPTRPSDSAANHQIDKGANPIAPKLVPSLPVAKPKCSRRDMRAGVFQLRKILDPNASDNHLLRPISNDCNSDTGDTSGVSVAPTLTLEVDNIADNAGVNGGNLSPMNTNTVRLSYSPVTGEDNSALSTAPTVPNTCVGFVNEGMYELSPET